MLLYRLKGGQITPTDTAERSSSSLSQELNFIPLLSPQIPREGRVWGFQQN